MDYYIVKYFPMGGDRPADPLGEYEDLDIAKDVAQKSSWPYQLNWIQLSEHTWHASRGNYGVAYYTITPNVNKR